jgi:hypothetical protein
MAKPRRRLAWIGSAVALTIAVQLLHGAPSAAATSPSTTATTAGPTPTSTGQPAPSQAVPDCNEVLAGAQQGSLAKTRVGGTSR